jgi:hypothetical protein
MYWSTGIIPPTGPIPLPIIFIPIVVIPGRVIVVIGLGICGCCPLPMIYFVNVADFPGCIIPPVNMVIDSMKQLTGKVMSAGVEPIKGIIKGLIKANDAKINDINDQISQLDMDLHNISAGIETDKETQRALQKRSGQDSTTHKRKNGVD